MSAAFPSRLLFGFGEAVPRIRARLISPPLPRSSRLALQGEDVDFSSQCIPAGWVESQTLRGRGRSWGSVIVNSPDVGEAKASRIPYSSGRVRLARSSTLLLLRVSYPMQRGTCPARE
jgi:hypothetical protein